MPKVVPYFQCCLVSLPICSCFHPLSDEFRHPIKRHRLLIVFDPLSLDFRINWAPFLFRFKSFLKSLYPRASFLFADFIRTPSDQLEDCEVNRREMFCSLISIQFTHYSRWEWFSIARFQRLVKNHSVNENDGQGQGNDDAPSQFPVDADSEAQHESNISDDSLQTYNTNNNIKIIICAPLWYVSTKPYRKSNRQ